MMIDSVEENYSSETINYKCPNPNCCDYGYAERGDMNEGNQSREDTTSEEQSEE